MGTEQESSRKWPLLSEVGRDSLAAYVKYFRAVLSLVWDFAKGIMSTNYRRFSRLPARLWGGYPKKTTWTLFMSSLTLNYMHIGITGNTLHWVNYWTYTVLCRLNGERHGPRWSGTTVNNICTVVTRCNHRTDLDDSTKTGGVRYFCHFSVKFCSNLRVRAARSKSLISCSGLRHKNYAKWLNPPD